MLQVKVMPSNDDPNDIRDTASKGGLREIRPTNFLRQFALKLAFILFFAGLQYALGFNFMRPAATMLIFSAFIALYLGRRLQQSPRDRHFTFYDEAAWFLLISYLLQYANGHAS